MKIVCVEGGLDKVGGKYLTMRPDSAVLRENDDFYLPHFSEDVVCSCGVLARIDRLAKCLNAKFASRCYTAIGAGVAFVARDVMHHAIAEGRPCDEAYCFDRSFAVSPEWVDVSEIGETTDLNFVLGQTRNCMNVENLRALIDAGIARASQIATLKTGDMVYIGISASARVEAGDKIEVCLEEKQMLCFGIK